MTGASPGSKPLTKEQKVGFALLLVFGVMAVALTFLQMRSTIYGPFARQQTQNPITILDEETRLQQIDTDQDGLNDFEELTFYETSPYLPDTDSDGVSDKDELDAGTDPNCAKGKNCESADAVPVSTSTPLISSPVGDDAGAFDSVIGSVTGSVDPDSGVTFADAQALIEDPERIRALLIKQGVDPAEVAQIDDQTLIKIANESFSDILQDQ